MKKETKWIIAGAVALFIIVIGLMYVSTSNTEIGLRNQAIAQEEANQVIFDKVWKVIAQKAQITDKYADDFKSIYTSIMHERYEGDSKQSPMFRWITEQNPNFSVELYKDISDAVESNRAEFARVQKRLIDIKREHEDLRKKFPGNIFVGSRPELTIKIVKSEKTDKAFSTGKEDNVDLFK